MGEIAVGAGKTRDMAFLSQAIRTFRERWPKITFRIFSASAATYNLIWNTANMVCWGVGAALGFDLNLTFDCLRLLPLSPAVETGTVLVWTEDQVLTLAVEAFHQRIKNVQQAYEWKENKH